MADVRRGGTNLAQVAGFNESVIFDGIRRAPDGISRVELTRLSGLSPQAVSNICKRLIDQGLVREFGKSPSRTGKPRTLIRLRDDTRYAIGIYIDPAVTTLVITNLAAKVVARTAISMAHLDDPTEAVSAIAEAARSLVADVGISSEEFLGAGVASPGPIVPETGLVVDPPHLHRWHHVRLREELSHLLGMPVRLDKDVIAAAIGERWAGASQSGNFLFFMYGTGIGTGIISHDLVIRGYSGNAGDIGMMPVVAPDRRRADRLHELVLPVKLVQRAVLQGILGHDFGDSTAVDVNASFRELCRLAKGGEQRAAKLLDDAAIAIGQACAVMADMMDADTVVLGGTLWEPAAELFLDQIGHTVESETAVGVPRQVVATTLGEDVAAIGAACLVLDFALSSHPAALPFEISV